MKNKIYLLILTIFLLSKTINAQLNEKLDRGIIALSAKENTIYVGWRLLKGDSKNIAFNVYRKDIILNNFEKIDSNPITGSTNYVDSTCHSGRAYLYSVKKIIKRNEQDLQGEGYVFLRSGNQPWYSIKLDNDITLKRIDIGDLDGDGAYDFVLQHPDFNVDPYHRPGYWRSSLEPYKLDAYSSKGKFMWRYNMGWAIETGTWYSPYMVYDIDGDGKDEIVFGTVALDDNGIPLWHIGLGHNDVGYVADIDPTRPGMEIFYRIESRSKKNGACLVEAKTGEIIWGYGEKTLHVHSQGMIDDIDPDHQGIECYAGEAKGGDKFFLYSAKGERLSDKNLWGLAPKAVWWDADELKEINFKNQLFKYKGDTLLQIGGEFTNIGRELIDFASGDLRTYAKYYDPDKGEFPVRMTDGTLVEWKKPKKETTAVHSTT